MSNNILPQSDFRSYLFSSQQQIHFPVSSPSARSSFMVSSSFQGQSNSQNNNNNNNNLQSYQTPPKPHHRSSLFDPRAQLKASKDNNGSLEMNFFSSNQKFKADLQNDLSNILNNSSLLRVEEASQKRKVIHSTKQQSTQSLSINPCFLSDREIVSPYVPSHSSNKMISIFSKKVNSSKSDLPMLPEQNEDEIHQSSQSNLQNQEQFNAINQSKQLTYLRDKHQKRSVSLDPITRDDILKDWLIGSTPQSIEPVTPIKIIERRRRRVSPAIVNQPALVEESPKVERIVPSNFKADAGVLSSSNRRLSKRDVKLEDSFSSQMNSYSSSLQNSQSLLQLNQHQPYAEDKSPVAIGSSSSSSPMHSSLVLKKILAHTQTQRLSVIDMINSTKSPFSLRKRQKASTNVEDYENQTTSNIPAIRITKEPLEGGTNEDEEGGDISNRYMPSSMDQGVSRYFVSTPSPINAKTSKGFMNLFRNNNNEKAATPNQISNTNSDINPPPPAAPHHQFVNFQSANTLQLPNNISYPTDEPQYPQNPQQTTTTRRQHIIRPQRRNLTDSSISYFENSVLKVETPKLKGVLKNKGDDFLKPRNESVNFSEMETLDDTSNRFSQSTRLGLSSMYSNGLSFQKEQDQGDYLNSESSYGLRKGSIKPSKKVIFQERVSIFDIATKFKTISTITKLQNRKL